MSKIAFLPIDNRPVCYQLPKMIANLDKKHSIFLPEIEFLGDLEKCADIENLFNWFESLSEIDIFVVSLDTIAYGGLIPSRRSNEKIEVIKKRVDKLFSILKKSSAKIYAFSSIMRISNNNVNEEEKEYWNIWGKKIFEYSFLYHKDGSCLTDVPKDILNDYINTRKRNFELNKYYLELKKQDFIDTLIFSKDDCAEFGLNVMEAQELKTLSQGIENVYIKTGADEIPLTLLSRAINKEKNIKICPIYTKPDCIDKISKYEDISVKDSVESQIDLSGAIVSNEKDSDMLLIVNNFEKEQGELVMNIDVPLFNGKLKLSAKPYFIADILNANGADNNFVSELLNRNLVDFYGFSAWNTTGNTLGGALSCALTYYKALQPNKNAFNELQTVRFLDDWAYQANIRKKIRNNKNNLSAPILKEYMKPFEEKIAVKFPITKEICYYFPWNRFFEIGILFIGE